MISPAPGVAFTEEVDGTMLDAGNVARVARSLGIPGSWATVSQVHGALVVVVESPGDQGEADGLVTSSTQLPVAVRTADCLGVVGLSPTCVGVAHAGWRGLAAGILDRFVEVMGDDTRYYVGPSIGPCCYEVGPEVAARFPRHLGTTTRGSPSVDLRAAAATALTAVEWIDERCTLCDTDLPSHRRDGTSHRIAAIGWL